MPSSTSTFGARIRDQFPPRTTCVHVADKPFVPPPPEWSRPPGELGKTLTIRAHYDALTGYGQLACGLTSRLSALGILVQCLPMADPWEPLEWGKAATIPDEVKDRVVSRNDEGWELMLASPHHVPQESPSVALSMWESNRLPEGTVANLNRFQALIVPCQWNQLAWDAAGVNRQMYKIGLPVSDCFFDPTPLPQKGPFTFGLVCRRAHGGLRKGVAEALECFLAAFGNRRDVRFRLKLYPDCKRDDLPQDPRIEVVAAAYTEAQMVEWYRSLHVYVSTSQAEGFGLCQAQSLAMGRPVMGVVGHAQSEYLKHDTCISLDYDLVRAEDANPENGYYSGYVWVPKRESVVESFRLCLGQPSFVQAAGSKGASLARRQFRWEEFANQIVAALRQEGLPV